MEKGLNAIGIIVGTCLETACAATLAVLMARAIIKTATEIDRKIIEK